MRSAEGAVEIAGGGGVLEIIGMGRSCCFSKSGGWEFCSCGSSFTAVSVGGIGSVVVVVVWGCSSGRLGGVEEEEADFGTGIGSAAGLEDRSHYRRYQNKEILRLTLALKQMEQPAAAAAAAAASVSSSS